MLWRAVCRGQGLTWRCSQPPGSSIGHLVYTPANGSCKMGSALANFASCAKASAWPGVHWGFRQLILEARRGGSGLRRARPAGATREWIYSTQTCSSLEQFACVPGTTRRSRSICIMTATTRRFRRFNSGEQRVIWARTAAGRVPAMGGGSGEPPWFCGSTAKKAREEM